MLFLILWIQISTWIMGFLASNVPHLQGISKHKRLPQRQAQKHPVSYSALSASSSQLKSRPCSCICFQGRYFSLFPSEMWKPEISNSTGQEQTTLFCTEAFIQIKEQKSSLYFKTKVLREIPLFHYAVKLYNVVRRYGHSPLSNTLLIDSQTIFLIIKLAFSFKEEFQPFYYALKVPGVTDELEFNFNIVLYFLFTCLQYKENLSANETGLLSRFLFAVLKKVSIPLIHFHLVNYILDAVKSQYNLQLGDFQIHSGELNPEVDLLVVNIIHYCSYNSSDSHSIGYTYRNIWNHLARNFQLLDTGNYSRLLASVFFSWFAKTIEDSPIEVPPLNYLFSNAEELIESMQKSNLQLLSLKQLRFIKEKISAFKDKLPQWRDSFEISSDNFVNLFQWIKTFLIIQSRIMKGGLAVYSSKIKNINPEFLLQSKNDSDCNEAIFTLDNIIKFCRFQRERISFDEIQKLFDGDSASNERETQFAVCLDESIFQFENNSQKEKLPNSGEIYSELDSIHKSDNTDPKTLLLFEQFVKFIAIDISYEKQFHSEKVHPTVTTFKIFPAHLFWIKRTVIDWISFLSKNDIESESYKWLYHALKYTE